MFQKVEDKLGGQGEVTKGFCASVILSENGQTFPKKIIGLHCPQGNELPEFISYLICMLIHEDRVVISFEHPVNTEKMLFTSAIIQY